MEGTTLGHYRVGERLGSGGMGEVYRAHDPRLKRDVAIKVLPDDLRQDPKRRERFLREAEAVADLNHPHICTLHDVGQHDGTDFLVMELLEGETLADRLRKFVEFEDWLDERERLLKTSYECPFCQESFTLEAAGRVVRTTPSVRHLLARR